MTDYYLYALCIAMPVLLIVTGFRDRVAPVIDRIFARFDPLD